MDLKVKGSKRIRRARSQGGKEACNTLNNKEEEEKEEGSEVKMTK